MKKTKRITLTILLSLLFCNQVNAACTQQEINGFKKIEDKYTVTYTYDATTKLYTAIYTMPSLSYSYEITLDNDDGTSKCEVISANQGEYKIKCTGKKWNNRLEYTIKGNTGTCNDTLKTGKVNVEKTKIYNKYSESELCKGIEEFVLCQETYDKELTQEEFESRVETYKKTLEKENKEDEKTENNNKTNKIDKNITEKIINYIENHIATIVIVVAFVILAIITIILTAKSIKKSRRLE